MLIGLALGGLDLLSSSHGGVVRSGANTIKLRADLLNKGTTIERPLDGDIFGFKLYTCRGATLEGAQVSDHITLFADVIGRLTMPTLLTGALLEGLQC